MTIEIIIKEKLEEQGYQQVFFVCGTKERYYTAFYVPSLKRDAKKAKKIELKVEQSESNKFVAYEFIKNAWITVAEIMISKSQLKRRGVE